MSQVAEAEADWEAAACRGAYHAAAAGPFQQGAGLGQQPRLRAAVHSPAAHKEDDNQVAGLAVGRSHPTKEALLLVAQAAAPGCFPCPIAPAVLAAEDQGGGCIRAAAAGIGAAAREPPAAAVADSAG
jgi:hypothetical protein